MQTVFPPSDLYNWVSRIYEPGSRLLLTEYAFPVYFGSIAAGGSAVQNVQMTQNADFVLTTIECTQDGNGGAVDDLKIAIVDNSTGEQFSNGLIPLNAISFWGTSAFKRNLPYPKWIAGVSSISLSLYAETLENRVSLLLKGFQIRKLA